MNFTDDEMATYRLMPGDLLLSEASGSPGEVGKPAIWNGEITDCAFQNTLLRVRPRGAEPRYLLRYFEHLARSGQFAEQSQGVGINHLGRAKLASWPVPMPPVEEQRRIAGILDRADALRAKRRESLALLDGLTQSIFLDMFGHPRLSSRFESRPLVDVCHAYSGGTPATSHDEYWHGSVPWFSPKDLKTVELYDSKDHLSESALSGTNLRLLPAHTVVIVVRGMILAHTVPVSVTMIPATINQDLKALIPREPVDPTFLLWAVRAQHDSILSAVSVAAHGTKRLDSHALSETAIPRPGGVLEKDFARKALAVRRLSGVTRLARSTVDELFDSLRQRAFAGRL